MEGDDSTSMKGKDRVGIHYFSQTIMAIRELQKRRRELIDSAGSASQEMRRALNATVSGFYTTLT
jgi:hypothetical protein